MVFEITNVRASSDLLEVINLSLENGRELGLDVDRANLEKLYDIFQVCQDSGILVLARDVETEQLVGAVAAFLNEMWWSDERYLCGIMTYVKPEFRNKKIATQMLEKAKAEAKDKNLPFMILFDTNKEVKSVLPFFKKEGFKTKGVVFEMME